MGFKNTFCNSIYLRIGIVIMGMGLIFFRGLQSASSILESPGAAEVPLIEAAAVGNVEKVKNLLHNGAAVNAVDNGGNSALAFAIWNGIYPANQQVIELLLSHQADTRSRNKEGIAVVQNVVKTDYKELRMQLIGKVVKFGGVISDMDNRGYDVLQKNLENYDTTSTGMILDWWGRLISPAMLERAKQRARDYNLRDILVVLNKGIKRPVKDAHWNPEVIDKRTGLNDLHCAVIAGDLPLVKEIVARKANINKNSEDEYGMTPLHYAVLHYNPEMVEYLVGNNANVNINNRALNRPLHMIAWLTKLDVAKQIADILIAHGADINAQNKDGNTLLHMLVYKNDRGLINYLGKKYPVNLGIMNNDREAVEQLAQRLNRKDLLENIR